MENGVFRRSDMTIKIKVLNVWGSVICNIEKMGIGFFQFRVIILRYSFIFARAVDCAREIYCWSIGAGCVCMPSSRPKTAI